MAFYWIPFLEENNIHFVRYGPNTKRGEVSISCPLCGDDPTEHLGIDPVTGWWACWRDASHRGRNPVRLVQALIGCSYIHAKTIVGQHSITSPDLFEEAAKGFMNEEKNTSEEIQKLSFPREFRRIKNEGTTKRFYKYLEDRHFGDVDLLCKEYKLRCASTGYWKDRIIVPIYGEDWELESWTARAIVPTKIAPRYLTLSTKPEADPKAKVATGNTLLFLNELFLGGSLLLCCEGPFDALKLDWVGYDNETRATCLFGVNMTIQQLGLLQRLTKHFTKIVQLLDAKSHATVSAEFRTSDDLATFGISFEHLPPEYDDPGSMTEKQSKNYIDSLLKKYKI